MQKPPVIIILKSKNKGEIGTKDTICVFSSEAIFFLLMSCEYRKEYCHHSKTGSTRIYTRVQVRTLACGVDALVSDNERVVESGLAVDSKGRDTTVDLNRGGGADESDGRSEKEGKHKKTKRPHDAKEQRKLGK